MTARPRHFAGGACFLLHHSFAVPYLRKPDPSKDAHTIAGIPQIPADPPVHMGPLNLGNVHVENSNVGLINTGTMQSVASAIGTLTQQGNSDVAQAIGRLLLTIREVDDAKTRDTMADLLGTIADEASKSADDRRLGTIRACLSELSTLAGGALAVSQLWQQLRPIISGFFGM